MPQRLVLLVLLLFATLSLAQGELTVFTLHSKPAQELLPLLQPLLGDEGSASAFGDKLIVRAPAARLDEIRWLVDELDRPARNLMVEVRVDRHAYAEDQHLQAGAHYGEGGGGASVIVRHAGTRGSGDIAQSVRTVDGRAALISVGQAVPVYEVEQSVGPFGGTSERIGVQYRDVSSGFYVLPRLHGEDGVTLEVYQQNDRPAVQTGHFDVQHASSVLRGRLGEWIALGSIDSRGGDRHSGIGLSASTRRSDSRYLSVRVTPVE